MLQPLSAPGFSLCWLEAVSHRAIMPRLLRAPQAQVGCFCSVLNLQTCNTCLSCVLWHEVLQHTCMHELDVPHAATTKEALLQRTLINVSTTFCVFSTQGWALYESLLVALLRFMEPYLRVAELSAAMRTMYTGTLRLMLVRQGLCVLSVQLIAVQCACLMYSEHLISKTHTLTRAQTNIQ